MLDNPQPVRVRAEINAIRQADCFAELSVFELGIAEAIGTLPVPCSGPENTVAWNFSKIAQNVARSLSQCWQLEATWQFLLPCPALFKFFSKTALFKKYPDCA